MLAFPEPPAVVQQAIDYRRLLDCIKMVEGRRWTSMGGALGFTLAVWHEDSHGLPFSDTSNPGVAYLVGERRLRRLSSHLRSIDVRTMAQVWRSGLTGVLSGRPRQPDYGQRVANLYFERN